MRNLLKIFKKSSKKDPKSSKFREAIKKKYDTFQNLLTKNNNVLELMADMEEKLSGEYLFDRHYLETNTKLIADGVLSIIEDLNTLAHGRYKELYKTYDDIYKEIKESLNRRSVVPVSDLTIPLLNLTGKMSNIAGGKIAHLGEIKNRLNLPTPDGFAITTYSFKRFMEHNRLIEKINKKLLSLDINNIEELNEVSRVIQDMTIKAEMPQDLENAIKKAVEGLETSILSLRGKAEAISSDEIPRGVYPERNDEIATPSARNDRERRAQNDKLEKVMFSVRSSAIHEDGEFSFAGQYSTFLNVPADLITQKYKEVVASLFTPRAIFYYKTKGFSEEEMVMAVGILRMVDALAGGVMYTRDPNDPGKDILIINAVWGLGMSVVDGSVTPDSYVVSREPRAIIERRVAEQNTMVICSSEGNIKQTDIPGSMKNKSCLPIELINILSDHAVALEDHYGRPQDIEWAVDRDNQIYILQTRPLRTFQVPSSKFQVPRKIDGYNILLDKGVIACKGIGFGKAFVLKDDEELKDFPDGAVLVAKHTSTKFVTVMNKASAIITDVGGVTGHMASLAREYQIPAILDAEAATSIIKDGQEITVDAINCNIYEGKVRELLEYSSKKREPFKNTRLFMTLEKALKWVVPLNLIDPDAENFKPELCKTFHDITRFAHEMAMAMIFRTSKGHDITSFEDLMSAVAFAESGEEAWPQPIALRAGIPIDANMIDIDGNGIKDNVKKAAPEDIYSIPFSAFLKGMVQMKWPEPRPADAKGFFGMVAQSASIPEGQLYAMGEKSFAILSGNYMNFSIRLGYHFSMVEAYAGENMNDNYIKFFFKGGGAVRDRKLRRVRLIKEILKKMDFKVNVTEDVVNAIITKYKQPTIEEKLETMGKLTAYTKQLDMVMYNDDVTDMFIEDFIRDHIKTVNSCQ
ncbi:MAG: PEP/pyruvate-binding domain-containing protein [Thermodesulfovibrionales bacterium]